MNRWARVGLAVAVFAIVLGASLTVAGMQAADEAPEDSPAWFETAPSRVGDRGLYKTALVVVRGESGEYHDMEARYAFERLPDRPMLRADGEVVATASFMSEWRTEPYRFDLRDALRLPDVPLFDGSDCFADVDYGQAQSDPDAFEEAMEACGEQMEAAGEAYADSMEAWAEQLEAGIQADVLAWVGALDATTHRVDATGWQVTHHDGNASVARTTRTPGADVALLEPAIADEDVPRFELGDLTFTHPAAVQGPCGWRTSLQGGPQDLFDPITVHGACPPDMVLGFADVTSLPGPLELRVSGKDRVDGAATVVFSEPDDPDRLRLWFDGDVPYPVRILTRTDAVPEAVLDELDGYEPPRFYVLHELIEFETGADGSSPTLPPRPDLLGAATVTGPMRGDFDHPWPLDAAWQDVQAPGSDCLDWTEWLRQHPDARIATAVPVYEEGRNQRGPIVDERWIVTAGDGNDGAAVQFHRHTETVQGPAGPLRVPQIECLGFTDVGVAIDAVDALPRIDRLAKLMTRLTGTVPSAYSVQSVGSAPGVAVWSGPGSPSPADAFDHLLVDQDGGLVQRTSGRGDYPEPTFSDPAWSPHADDAWGYRVASTGVWHMPEPATAASLAAGAAAAGLLVLLLPLIKSTLAAAPFFTRIRREDLLEHPVRGQLSDLVNAEPGIHFQEIVRRLEKGRGTTEHHLRKLVSAGLVVEKPAKGFTCYFPKGQVDRRLMEAAPLMKSSGARQVMQAVVNQPGAAAQDIAQRLGMAPSTVNYHVKKLRAAGLVEAQRQGRFVVLQTTELGDQAVGRFGGN